MKQFSQGLATSGMTTLAWSTSPPFPAGGRTNGPYFTVVTSTPPAAPAPAGPASAGRAPWTTTDPGNTSTTPRIHPSRFIMVRDRTPTTGEGQPPGLIEFGLREDLAVLHDHGARHLLEEQGESVARLAGDGAPGVGQACDEVALDLRRAAAADEPDHPALPDGGVGHEQVPRRQLEEGHVDVAGRGAGHRGVDLGHRGGDLRLQAGTRAPRRDVELVVGHGGDGSTSGRRAHLGKSGDPHLVTRMQQESAGSPPNPIAMTGGPRRRRMASRLRPPRKRSGREVRWSDAHSCRCLWRRRWPSWSPPPVRPARRTRPHPTRPTWRASSPTTPSSARTG